LIQPFVEEVEDSLELLHILRAEHTEQLLVRPLQHPPRVAVGDEALVGDGEEDGALVGGVRPALDPPLALHPLEQERHACGFHVRPREQIGGGQLVVVRQGGEHPGPRGGQPERGEPLVEQVADFLRQHSKPYDGEEFHEGSSGTY
jgi:hypothetical protein